MSKKDSQKIIITVRRQWNDYRQAEISLDDISGLHWSNFSGGVRAPSPHTMIYGYVSCTDVQGDIGHSCMHGEAPHNIKVCVVKKDNSNEVYKILLKMVGEKPKR